MAESYIGEIRMFGGNYAPAGWVLCDGSILSISSYDTLFALIGTYYGGNGVTTFGVPDLRGKLPVHTGTGPGLTTRVQGQTFGVENITLGTANLFPHTHAIAAGGKASTNLPDSAYLADATGFDLYAVAPSTGLVAMDAAALDASGGTGPVAFSNLMPGQCVNFIMATVGVFPVQG